MTLDTRLKTAQRPIDPQRNEPRILASVGGGLLALAALFLWRDLHVQAEVLMVIGAAASVALAAWLLRANVKLVSPLVLLASSGVAFAWYGLNREPVLLVALTVLFAGAVAVVALEARRERLHTEADRWHRLTSWHTVGLTGLATSFAYYFQIFDASDLALQNFVARRVLLTLTWLMVGIVLVLQGRSRKRTEVRDAGFLVLAVSVAKLVFYDLSHLDGALRIGLLCIAGVALLVSSAIANRLNRAQS